MAFRTSNPALNDNAFRSDYDYSQAFEKTDKMTLAGTATKTLILLMITVASAAFSWTQFATQDPEQISSLYPYVIGSMILGLALAIVIIFKQTLAPVLSPVYALAEGFFLGIISAIFNAYYPGIALQAVCLTFGTLFCMMFLYRTGIIKVTQTFRLGVVSATGGVAIFYIINFIMGAFGHHITILYSNSPLGIGISFVIVIIAALNLVLDFDFIDKGVEAGCPKYMEWYGAFGLLVTLVWLYLEILRLLAKMRR